MLRIDSSEYKEINTVNRITGQSQIQYTSMLSDLITMPKRNRLILETIKDLVVTDNRKILVLSDRREHLKSLKQDFLALMIYLMNKKISKEMFPQNVKQIQTYFHWDYNP